MGSIKAMIKIENELWKKALEKFVSRTQSLYGNQLEKIILYGSRARGDFDGESDFDLLIVLRELKDFWKEFHKIEEISWEVSFQSNLVFSAIPASKKDLERSQLPIFLNIRKEGVEISG